MGMPNVLAVVNAIVQRGGKIKIPCYILYLSFLLILSVITSVFVLRKLRVKRSIKVPAISNKVADIPPDEYSWRKYGQKPIKGSPHPR
jgi:hypothetical protein